MKIFVIIGIISVLCALGIVGAFALRRALYNMVDRRIERFQSELIEKQVREIQNMYRQIRGWRHDYRNHIQNMKIWLGKGDLEKISGYLDQLADDLDNVDTVMNVKANVPEGLPMSDVELCSMLGNMLDNAVEACAALPEEERFMRVYIGRLKGQLYLSVQNSAGKVRKEKGAYLSTKENASNEPLHGYGLFRIDRVVKKYGGYVNRQNEDGVFATELMIPVAAAES